MKLFKFILCTAMLAIAAPSQAASNQASAALNRLEQELKDNSPSVETLANTTDELRLAAMEAAAYPNVLWDMDREQKQSSDKFQRLITSYPRKTQEKIYDLVRYQSLIEDLVEGGPKTKDQIKAMTRNLPKGVQEAAKELGTKEYPLLRSLRDLNMASDRDFENSLQGIPEPNREAYRKLLRHPDILRALSDDRDLTLALGDAYRANPKKAQAKLSEFGAQAAQQHSEALNDYRQTLASNPEARKELEKSAQAFAKENGYDAYDDYYPPPSSGSQETVVNININPYPYWFGYPYWYSMPLWYPYPLWYWTGFWGWGSSFYAWGFPSYYYTNWFYGYPRHFYRYPYLSSCYGNYYYRYRGRPYYYSGFNRGVNQWYNRYGYRTQGDMWRGDPNSSQRWRDFGERQETQRRSYRPASASYQPQGRDLPGRGSQGKPDFVKGAPPRGSSGDKVGNVPDSGRGRGRGQNDSMQGQGPGTGTNRRGSGPTFDRSRGGPQGSQADNVRQNPRFSPNNENALRGPSNRARDVVPDSTPSGNRPNISPNPRGMPNSSGGSYGMHDPGSSSFGSGRGRSGWSGGSSSGFRSPSSFGSGSGRSSSPSFGGGGGGRSFGGGGGGGRSRGR